MNIKFKDAEHRSFFEASMKKSKRQDTYHRSALYTLGLTEDTRRNIDEVFNFAEDCIEPDGLFAGWQTSGTMQVCRMAFNLWNGYVDDCPESSTPSNLFCSEFAPYFIEAIKLRYPQYCGE